MKKRAIKLIICIMIVSAMMVGFSTVSYAALPNRTAMQRFNAWVASAITAANITIGSTVAPVQQVLDTLSYGANMPWTPEYTYQGSTWDDAILDRSKIYIAGDVVEIDGVPYTDIWLSNDAAQKFRVNAFDLETAWNIASNSNGTYATGSGYVNGTPVFQIDGSYRSQRVLYDSPGSYSTEGMTTTIYPVKSNRQRGTTTASINGVNSTANLQDYSDRFPWWSEYRGRVRSGGVQEAAVFIGNSISSQSGNYVNHGLVLEEFDFDWISATIPGEELPEDYGMHFLVPSSYDGGQGSVYNYDIHDLITLNPNITDPGGYQFNFDPTLNPDYELDIDTSDALGAIISAIIAAKLADLLDGDGVKIEYAPREPAPAPDPDKPDPEVPIGEQNPIWLDNLLRWIKSTIDSLGDRIHTDLDQIKEVIQNIIQSIEELADKILEDIELGPAKLFDKALDILKTLFLPFLLPIRAMMNLWHYVVEWIQSVSSPFTWIFGIMSGTSGNMVLPIYALLAGGICISIYKALGR